MTGNHEDTSITRRRALVVSGGTVAAGGLAVAGLQSAFADVTEAGTDAGASPVLRAELGAIGRSTEHSVALAGGGHRGDLWALGLLVAAAALDRRAKARKTAATARRIAAFDDKGAPRRPSRGSSVSATYGGRHREPGPSDALLTVMSTLRDTELLHAAGPFGLRRVQAGARGDWRRAARRRRRARRYSQPSTPTCTSAAGARGAARA